MQDFNDALFLLTETRAIFNRAMIGYAGFLVVYKFLMPQTFRSLKVDPILAMAVLYFLFQLSLRGGPAIGW